MWAKLSNALKPRQDDNDAASVLQGQHHPNPSTISLVPNPDAVPSPPSSPSKQGRRGMFKLLSKAPKGDDSDAAPSFGLGIGLPKKVKSHLHLNGNSSQASFARVSTDVRPSQDTLRSYQDPMPRTSQDGRRSPVESSQGPARSILRLPKTPGTGQNVRFFSRDAYKRISPDQSTETHGTPEPMSFGEQLHKVPDSEPDQAEFYPMPPGGKETGKRPSVTEIFAPANQSPVIDTSKNLKSLMMPIPSADMANIFDMSQDRELPTITPGNDMHMPLIDSAAEMMDGANQAFTSTPHRDYVDKTTYHSMDLLDAAEDDQENTRPPTLAPALFSSNARGHERTHSSFGRTVFHSLSRSSASSSEKSRLSDSSSIFRSRPRVMPMPDADIDDSSSAELVVYTGPTADQPDPFRANAMTYYTPQTMIPPTPPSNHLQATSKEEDVILSLRTQLALQQELCTQYEIDLGARDEIVQMLTARCEKTEKEGERRRGVLRTWKKKVGELEKICRGLEEEVEKSREESWERSVMDEASGEALKCLQRRIETLEREKSEVEKNAQKVLEEKGGLEMVLEKFKEGLMDAKEHIQEGNDAGSVEDLKARLVQQEHTSIAERERHRMAEFEWEEERAELISRRTQLETFKDELADELAAAQEQLTQKDQEYGILKGELEAQWRHTESAGEQAEEMRKEMDRISEEGAALESRIAEMVLEWNESESRRSDLESKLQEAWSVKTTLETEKHELEEQVCEQHERNDHLTKAWQDHNDHLAGLASEHQFTTDSVSRLEADIRQRDAEISDYSQRVAEHEIAAEQLREQMADMEREHARILDEQVRHITSSDDDTRQQMAEIVRAKEEADVMLVTLKERVSVLKDEVERLRRQVHELQQESADKEVKIVQLTKQRSQDKEDIQGLNIALDSKQQELELLKRKLGVKGTAGSTPGQPSKTPLRRDSLSAFTTPGMVRPPSALSDTSKDNTRGIETPASAMKPLTKSIRTNGSLTAKSAMGSMGPPPLKHSRVSLGTPTPPNAKPTALARSSSVKPAATSSTPSINRRASSAALEQARMKLSASGRKINESPAPSELGEKENIDLPTPAKVKRRASVMLTPA